MDKQLVKSKNGDLFIIVYEGRQVALGLIARGNNRSGKLGYFFDLKYLHAVSDVADLKLNRRQAIYVCKFSYLEIRNGNWPTIGTLKDFSREDWPMPVFETIRNEPYHYHTYTMYDEEYVHRSVFHCNAAQAPKNLDLSFVIEDQLAGAIFVAIRLERLLGAAKNN